MMESTLVCYQDLSSQQHKETDMTHKSTYCMHTRHGAEWKVIKIIDKTTREETREQNLCSNMVICIFLSILSQRMWNKLYLRCENAVKTLSQHELLVYFIDLLEISGWNWTTTFQLKKAQRVDGFWGDHPMSLVSIFMAEGTRFQKKCLKLMPLNMIPVLHMLAQWPGLQTELQGKNKSF